MPEPTSSESQSDFMGRCMGHESMMEEFPEQDQRVAVCMTQWRRHEEDGKMGAQLELPAAGQRKAVTAQVKVGDAGQFEAVIATFNVVDLDGDVTLPGAFEEGAEVIVSAYGHGSWMGELPVGKGVLKSTERDARIVGEFFLDTTAGKDHYAVAKRLGAKQEWSYGYDVLETGKVEDLPPELQAGARRVLAKQQVHEASPVLKGAGIDTRTVVVKTVAPVTPAPKADAGAVHDAALKELARFEQTRARLLFHPEINP
jgi:hypothetical protein